MSTAFAHEGHEALPKKGVTVQGDRVALTLEARNAIGLQTADVETRTLERSILATAVVELAPDAHVFATTQVAGRIEQVLVEPGKEVKADDTLAMLRSSELEKLLLEATTAELERKLALTEVQRLDDLEKQGVRNPRERLAAQNRAQERANAVLVARLKLQALGVDPVAKDGLLPIRAPAAGVVAMVDVVPGAMVEPEQHLFDIVNPDRVRVRVEVPEAYVPQLALGQAVELRFRGQPVGSPPQRSTIAARTGRIDSRKLTETVWVTLPAPLRAGLGGVARIIAERREKVFTVPESAVIRDGIETYVFVQMQPATKTQAGMYERKHVTLGLSQSGHIEIKSGLFSIDSVVTTGQRQLATLFVQGVLRPTPTARRNVGLEIGAVSSEPIAAIVETDAVLELPPTGRTVVASPLPAKVVRVAVPQPRRVEAGEPLIELASLDFQNLQLDLIQAELAARLHQATVDSYKKVEPRGALPEQLLREAETSLAIATARVQSAVRRLEALGLTAPEVEQIRSQQKTQASFTVRALRLGDALPESLSVGQVLKEGAPLFEIQDRSRLWVRGRVFDQDLLQVKAGQPARLRLASLPSQVIDAKVARVEAFAHTAGRSAAVWAEVDNSKGLLRENQLGRLAIEVDSPRQTTALPLAALWREGTEWQAFFYDRKTDTFTPRLLELGRRDDRFAEIRTGLRQGDAIAVTAVADLRRGYGRIK